MSAHEWQVLVLFIILVLLWFFKTPVFIRGWGDLFKKETMRDPKTTVSVSSATPAVLIVALVFILPREYSSSKSSPALLDWPTGKWSNLNFVIAFNCVDFVVEKRLPWGVILLLGGGFALADVTKKSGLSMYLVKQLEGLKVQFNFNLWEFHTQSWALTNPKKLKSS